MLLDWARQLRRRYWVLPRIHRSYNALTIQETFQKIYQTKAWGDGGTPFCSGAGSDGVVSQRYVDNVAAFVHERGIRSVADLGCGDFAVGRRLVESTGVQYTGIDVVPELIEHHQRTIDDPRVTFRCAEIGSDALPTAELCLIRQVLQHLSNREIAAVLDNVANYPLVLVSEDVPAKPQSYNRDKPHGPDVRAYFGSGVFLDQPPFSKKVRELWTIPLREDAVLRSVLLEHTPPARSN